MSPESWATLGWVSFLMMWIGFIAGIVVGAVSMNQSWKNWLKRRIYHQRRTTYLLASIARAREEEQV